MTKEPEVVNLEHKFCAVEEDIRLTDGSVIEGYASLFGQRDQGGDTVQPGAYAGSLSALAARGGRIKMLWQHDPTQPIGVWDEVGEDARGLYVRGRILQEIDRGREAVALVQAGAIDGLSIGYRTRRSLPDGRGRRILSELELWEVSLVTFPMLPDARLGGAKGDDPEVGPDPMRELAAMFRTAAKDLTRV